MTYTTPQLLRRALVGVTLLVLSSGCVGNPPAMTGGAVLVAVGPPPPRREARPRPPGREYIWIEGYHRWTGAEYAWVPGHWERRPHGRAHWKKGRWYHSPRGWYWSEGHWEER